MEKRTCRSFTDAFKAETVELVRSSGKTMAQISRDLGLTETAFLGYLSQRHHHIPRWISERDQ